MTYQRAEAPQLFDGAMALSKQSRRMACCPKRAAKDSGLLMFSWALR
jgi:hypothetical protein